MFTVERERERERETERDRERESLLIAILPFRYFKNNF